MTLWRAVSPVLLLLPMGAASCSLLPAPQGSAAPVFSQSGRWTDEGGQAVSLASFAGAPVVLSAFFTSCTTRCPMTIDKLRDVDNAYRQSGMTVPIVLLTLDPTTDTGSRLQRLKAERNLPDNWHFLRGSLADTRTFAKALNVHAVFDDSHIDHDVRIVVFDASGREARAFGTWSFDPKSAVVR
jgi:protein SCO1/2